jgi:hypothetical protein
LSIRWKEASACALMFEIGAFSTFHSFENEFLAFIDYHGRQPFCSRQGCSITSAWFHVLWRLHTRIFTRVGMFIGAFWLDLRLAALLFL